MKLSEELTWRGFVNQTTYSDITAVDDGPISFYLGVDPSSDSMTIGNLVSVMLVKHFIKHGHKAYVLVGGATGLIGDPDGKLSERQAQSIDVINKNKAGIAAQYMRILNGQDFTLVDNYDWFKDIKYLDFLSEVGKNVPMSQMLGRDFIKTRLGKDGAGISYAEFSYSLIQGYDFLHLSRRYGVTLQICGADQWGNSITGVDLVRRLDGNQVHVYSIPLLINKSTGVKFGKSENGALWLDDSKTSVYKFYQFWLNSDDDGVVDYLKFFTMLDKTRIDELAKMTTDNPEAREAQKVLAHEVTTLIHGAEKTSSVERVISVLFGGDDFSSLGTADLDEMASEIPVVQLGLSLVDTLTSSSIASSRGEARRLIEGGAISINGNKKLEDMIIDFPALIKKGKNSFVLVR